MPNVDELLAGDREAITVRRVFGEAYEKDGVTVIPAAAVRGGGGGGGDAEGGGGGGFGVQARPVGAYVVRDGEVKWKPAVDPNRIVACWQADYVLALLVAWAFARTLRSRYSGHYDRADDEAADGLAVAEGGDGRVRRSISVPGPFRARRRRSRIGT